MLFTPVKKNVRTKFDVFPTPYTRARELQEQ